MTAEGVAALNLAEVARRMGLMPAALYQYFGSKNAVYEAPFAAGMADLEAILTAAETRAETDPVAALRASQQVEPDVPTRHGRHRRDRAVHRDVGLASPGGSRCSTPSPVCTDEAAPPCTTE
jgi:AcrR family transcriptional regulator